MVIMLGHEEGQIQQTHRLLQAWVSRCTFDRGVGKLIELAHELGTEFTEGTQYVIYRSGIMIGIMGLSVGEIRVCESRPPVEDVGDALHAKRLTVK